MAARRFSSPTRGADRPPPAPGVTRTVGRTVAILIGLNLVLQIVLVVVIINKHLGVVTAVRISLVTGVVFYAVTAMVVRALSQGLGLRPRLGTGDGLAGAAEGVVVGGGAAVLLSALLRLAFGRPAARPDVGGAGRGQRRLAPARRAGGRGAGAAWWRSSSSGASCSRPTGTGARRRRSCSAPSPSAWPT